MTHYYSNTPALGRTVKLGLALLLGLTLAACGGPGASTVPRTGTLEEKHAYMVSHIDDLLAQQQDASQPGLSIVIVKDGAVAYSRSKGMADIARNTPISEQTVFELASLTKPITAIAVMQLEQRKLLSLNDTIAKWLPQLPQTWGAITVHQLLSHQTGIPDYMGGISPLAALQLDGFTNDDLFKRFALDSHLNFAPGTSAAYSNSNYVILAEIIARASGRSYAQYVQENIFTPLGMRSSYVTGASALQPGDAALNYARSTTTHGASFVTVGPIGVHSSAADMTLLLRSLGTGRLVSLDTLAVMTSPKSGFPVLGSGEYYGYGWFMPRNSSPLTLFAHRGGADGFRNIMRVNYTKGIYYVILSNGGDATEKTLDAVLQVVQPLYE
ncbi:serine hydrolase domain-containing protein [Massilia sp. TWP1-3-3]|uniref:serine hydrolase domain-containing protein n=1 Tax=Massilia sp. TWP1-3-3 TaxID=2804573 RepID=UPI003CF66A74